MAQGERTDLINKTTEERFWSKVDIKHPNKCWVWKANIGKDGYGQFWYKGKIIHAHRMSLHISEGLPLFISRKYGAEEYALHKPICPNKACVNPNHLYVGSSSDNRIDIDKAGTASYRKSKFSKEDMAEMKKLKEVDGMSQEDIGRRYGITQQAVSYILKGVIKPNN